MNFCIMLLFDTGMRCNEMILMEPEDIKPDYILVKHGKDSKERVVPKSPALSKQLMEVSYPTGCLFKGIPQSPQESVSQQEREAFDG